MSEPAIISVSAYVYNARNAQAKTAGTWSDCYDGQASTKRAIFISVIAPDKMFFMCFFFIIIIIIFNKNWIFVLNSLRKDILPIYARCKIFLITKTHLFKYTENFTTKKWQFFT